MKRSRLLSVLAGANIIVLAFLGFRYQISLKARREAEQKKIVQFRAFLGTFYQGEDLNRMTEISMEHDSDGGISQSNIDWAINRLKDRGTGVTDNLRRMELLQNMGSKMKQMSDSQREQVLSAAIATMKHQNANDEVGSDLIGCLHVFAGTKDPKVIPYVKEISNDPRPHVKAQATTVLEWYENGMKKK